MTDFASMPARSLARGLADHEWTSVELTTYFLDRIAEKDGDVRAVAIVTRDEALQQARESDARRARGETRGPFDGLPMTVKDSLRMRGYRSTYGMFVFRRYKPSADCELARAMREEGLVFLGRTAVPTSAFDWNCRNEVYAECVNPYDHARTPGGSSGGAAAAVALGLTPFELGSDVGGSIRYPAHCCGVYGLRTTDGLLPTDDIGPESIGTGFRHLVALGPIAKSLDDLRPLLEIFTRRLGLKQAEHPARNSKKIAFSRSFLGIAPEKDSLALFDSYLAKLRSRGFELHEVESPIDVERLYKVWGLLGGYDYTNVILRLLRVRPVKAFIAWWLLTRRLGRGRFRDSFRAGLLASREEFEAAVTDREDIFAEFAKFFETYVAWITPISRGPAFLLKNSGKPITSEGQTLTYSEYVGTFVVPTVATGLPALAVPIGRVGGLPFGAQIFGPRFSDAWLIDFAEQL